MMQMRVSYLISGVALALGIGCFHTDHGWYGTALFIASLVYYANGVICEKRGK